MKIPGPQRSTLLVVMYGNPAFHPPTINAVRLMGDHFRVFVVHRNDDGPPAQWPPDVEVRPIGPSGAQGIKSARGPAAKLAEFTGFIRELRRTLAEARPQFVYAYDPVGFSAAMRARGGAVSPPVIFHCHDLPALDRPRFTSLQFWISRYALRRTRDAALVVFPSEYRAQAWLERARDRRPALIVPNGAARDFSSPCEDLRSLAGIRFQDRRALYLGSMSPENGQAGAIAALAMLPRTSLDIVGFGLAAYREELRTIARTAGVEMRVNVEGWVSDAERMRRLRLAALGLLLYRAASLNWEHSGSSANKLFEYAAMGLPVVVPDRKSFREFFAADSWVAYANPEDPASIARAIEFILADRARYVAMSLAARKAHEEKYNYETVFQPVLARLDQLAAGHGPEVNP